MRLHITEEDGDTFWCPECKRELWPAYWSEEGLEVAFWGGFSPPDGQEGSLVCASPACTYEEPVTFVESPDDAVLWNAEFTWMEFQSRTWWSWPQVWILDLIEETEALHAKTGQAKLLSFVELYRSQLEEQAELIERWLAEATAKGHPVTFRAAEEELSGQIVASSEEAFTLQAPDGAVRLIPKEVVWHLHIEYPRKPSEPHYRPEGEEWVGFPLSDDRFLVVEGYHLRYGGASEMGDRYTGRCWDAAAAAALRLREMAPGYWKGVFTAEEIERFYQRHDYVRIRGYWVEELSRIEKPPLVWARTKDPAIAEALAMSPEYTWEGDEFGVWDGEIFAYSQNFDLSSIEEQRWEEEPLTLPPEDWPS